MKSRSMLLPLIDIGHTIGQYVERRSPLWGRRYYVLMACLLVAVFGLFAFVIYTDNLQMFFTTPVRIVERLLPYDRTSSGVDLFFIRVVSFGLVVMGYLLLLSFPASSLFYLVRRSVTDSRPKLRAPKKPVFLKNRLRASRDSYLVLPVSGSV